MRYFGLVFVIIAAVLLTGCSSNTAPPSASDSEQIQLAPKAQEVLTNETAGHDDMLFHHPGRPTRDWGGAHDWPHGNWDVYAVTYLWGSITNSDADAAPIDWSGTLSVNGVAIVDAHHTIDFDNNQDYLVPDSLDHLEEWVSFTDFDFDGISFLIYVDRDIVYITPPMATFATDPITIELGFGELEFITAFYPVNDYAGVAVVGRKVWSDDCPRGFMQGRWEKDSTNQSGLASGFWMDYSGTPIGYMSMMFWTNDAGYGLLSGSVSGLYTDQIIAWLEGTWYYDDPRMCPMCGDDHGVFRGSYVNIENGTEGRIYGIFGDYVLDPTDMDLPYWGAWRQMCPRPGIPPYWPVRR